MEMITFIFNRQDICWKKQCKEKLDKFVGFLQVHTFLGIVYKFKNS
ncbi:hypothetical protein SASC598O11_004380 [Snodgrassella alvi SCGC AB-598-O11]|nr:hypothetical protein SASC598O11_004380 [Snodgrassella alvi SCGC AB-598-O11]